MTTKAQIDAFLSEYAALCARHGLAIQAEGYERLQVWPIGGSENVTERVMPFEEMRHFEGFAEVEAVRADSQTDPRSEG